MSDKRKEMAPKEKRSARREKKKRREIAKLVEDGKLIEADVSQQTPSCYSTKDYYKNIEFKCSDCGAEEVWKAKDQKWYYEVVKGPIYARPKRCRACRKKRRLMIALHRKQMEAADRAKQQGKRESQ